MHQFFRILHFCHTCSLCRVELVVQVPARGSTQVLVCLFLVRCGCDTSYIVSVHIQCQAYIYTLSLCRGHSWRVRLAKQETLTPPGHLVSPLVYGVRECPPWCSIVGATVTVHQFLSILHFCHSCSLCRVELVVQVPARGSTQVLLCLFSWCVVAVILPI